MKFDRFIPALLSAAVFAVVMLFVPVAAQAHSGHEHVSAAHATHVQNLDIAKQHVASTPEASSLKPALQELSVHVNDGRADQGAGKCVGGCCSSGLGCCGAVMVTAQQALPDVDIVSAVGPLVIDYSPGIDPDALKRPPKALA